MAEVVSFCRRTRRRKVLFEVKERYVRDDLQCGMMHGQPVTVEQLSTACRTAERGKERIGFIVPDTNVALHQFDLLEHAATKCGPLDRLVISQTLLDEVKHNDRAIFRRLCALAGDAQRSNIVFPNEHCEATALTSVEDESINDRNDRAIRRVAQHLGEALKKHGDLAVVVLVTDDADCRRKAKLEGVEALSSRELCERLSSLAPSIGDLLSARDDNDDKRGAPREKLYAPHLAMSELMSGIASGRFVQGPLRCSRLSCWKGHVTVNDEDLLVEGSSHINRGVDGDIVALEIVDEEQEDDDDDDDAPMVDEGAAKLADECAPEEERKKSSRRRRGKVVGVIRRNWRQYCGSLELPEGATDAELDELRRALFVPVDRRCPKVVIESRQMSRLARQRLLVAPDTWRDDSRWPAGHYVRSLGAVGDRAVETDVLLREHDVATAAFSAEVLACLPPQGEDFVIDPEEIEKRLDLRSLTVCSIDPPGCRDIDDALHAVGPLENGAYQIGIHIADVTHFCKPGSALDVEASKRGTSTYLVDRRLDMLPVLLTANLCSLRADVERLAFSCLVEITAEGEVLKAEFTKSVIKSRAALTYHQAQMMIDGGGGDSPGVADSVRILAKIARSLRAKRIAAGALSLASPEVRFELSNESDSPTDVGAYQLVEANATVEEFMLLGNILVGKRCLETYPGLTLLRCHPSPPATKFKELIELAATVDITVDAASSKRLADSLDAAVRENDPYFNKLLRILSTRCMAPAKYFCASEKPVEEWLHYGLATPVYTHFTSPIRRYADVVVHRLLSAAIGHSPLPRDYVSSESKQNMAKLTLNLNRRNKSAQMAGRDSVALYTRLYFRDNPQERVEARVLAISPTKINVIVPRFGIEGPLDILTADVESDDAAVYDETKYELRFKDKVLRVFDLVYISILVEKPKSAADDVGSIKFTLLEPNFPVKPPYVPPPKQKGRKTASSKDQTAAATATANSKRKRPAA